MEKEISIKNLIEERIKKKFPNMSVLLVDVATLLYDQRYYLLTNAKII